MAMISIERATKFYNRGRPNEVCAVSDVSAECEQNRITVLKGPSGSGKTSLLGLIGCMSRPTSGKIVIQGRDVAKLPERFLTGVRRNTFGFIFQHFNLIPGAGVMENIMLPLYPTGMRFPEIRARTESIMEKLGLGHRRSFPVRGLSGGEQQRVAIGRALINDPEIILADEPTAHLDTKLSQDLTGILRTLLAEGRTIIIATHDPLLYDPSFADRIIEMRDGRVTGVSGK